LWEYGGDVDNIIFKNALQKWYCSAVFSEDYSGSSDSVMSQDFRDWKELLINQKPIGRTSEKNQDFINEIDFKDTRKGSARYNAVLCILALNKAEDFFKGRIVGTGDYSNEKINDHHIFPTGVKGLDPEKSRTFKDFKDSVVNRTLLLDETNNRIKSKKPSQYLADLANKKGSEEKVKDILEAHLISGITYEYMKADDFDNFVAEREKNIKEHIISKLGI